MSDHTPTPWRLGTAAGSIISNSPVGLSIEVADENSIKFYDGFIVCESLTPENALFVTRACNNFERLLLKADLYLTIKNVGDASQNQVGFAEHNLRKLVKELKFMLSKKSQTTLPKATCPISHR